MKNINFMLPDGRNFSYQTINVLLDGRIQTIVPLRSKFSMDSQVRTKDEVLTGITSDMILPTVLSLCASDVFTNENSPLYTLSGTLVPECVKFEGTPYVVLDKADNFQLLSMDILEQFDAKVIQCNSVQDAIVKMSSSAYVSQVPTKNDWIGYAGVNDITLSNVKEFALKYKVQGTVALAYFGAEKAAKTLKATAIKGNPIIANARSLEQATTLITAVAQAFGAKYAGQTRYLKGVNYIIRTYGFENTIRALNNIGGEEKLQIAAAACEDKANCLQNLLTLQISNLLRQQSVQQGAIVAQAV